jgi:hypothetical protein
VSTTAPIAQTAVAGPCMWPYVGDPSARQLLPRPAQYVHVKLTGEGSIHKDLQTSLNMCREFFGSRFSEAYRPTIAVNAHHKNYVTITWAATQNPSDATRSYAHGAVSGILHSWDIDLA